jgi:hypothetical protein
MRGKVTWWSCVIFFAVLYGSVGLVANVALAIDSIFQPHGRLAILHDGGGWLAVAAMIMLALTFAAGLAFAAIKRTRAAEACLDLLRLHGAALCGAFIPFALGTDHPWIYAPMAVIVAACALFVDRKGPAHDRPWQTWALASLTLLVALPVLLISRL